MTPEQRKRNSESILSRHAVPINPTLPLIESEEEVKLRTPDEVLQRLVALWAVAGTAFLPDNKFFRLYVTENNLLGWLSASERSFLLAERPTEQQRVHASWQLEALYFVAWCGGLVGKIELPTTESSVESFVGLFPQQGDDLSSIRRALSLRSVSDLLDWSDLLYRLHWAVRDARLTGAPAPSGVKGGVVQEWHRAANWMTRYEEENDWDAVPTDT